MADAAPVARPAHAADRQQLVEVLADAFTDDPIFVYIGAWRTVNGAGAAIWYPPDQWRPSTWALRQTPAALRVFGKQLPLASGALTTMQAHHPQQPHWYLSYLATVPGRQSTGIGSALLRPVLQRCDEEGSPAYLEATSERSWAVPASRLRPRRLRSPERAAPVSHVA